jgi:hypothetical protein
MVYQHLATLYFVFVFDSSENELAMLDIVQGNLTFWFYIFNLVDVAGIYVMPN